MCEKLYFDIFPMYILRVGVLKDKLNLSCW